MICHLSPRTQRTSRTTLHTRRTSPIRTRITRSLHTRTNTTPFNQTLPNQVITHQLIRPHRRHVNPNQLISRRRRTTINLHSHNRHTLQNVNTTRPHSPRHITRRILQLRPRRQYINGIQPTASRHRVRLTIRHIPMTSRPRPTRNHLSVTLSHAHRNLLNHRTVTSRINSHTSARTILPHRRLGIQTPHRHTILIRSLSRRTNQLRPHRPNRIKDHLNITNTARRTTELHGRQRRVTQLSRILNLHTIHSHNTSHINTINNTSTNTSTLHNLSQSHRHNTMEHTIISSRQLRTRHHHTHLNSHRTSRPTHITNRRISILKTHRTNNRSRITLILTVLIIRSRSRPTNTSLIRRIKSQVR